MSNQYLIDELDKLSCQLNQAIGMASAYRNHELTDQLVLIGSSLDVLVDELASAETDR